MNANNKKKNESFPLNREGKVSQEDINKFLACLKNESIRVLKTKKTSTEEVKTQPLDSALETKNVMHSSSLWVDGDSENVSLETIGSSGLTSTTFSANRVGMEHSSWLSVFDEVPLGQYFVNFRGASISEEGREMMNYVIGKMREKIDLYGENSTTITQKTWLGHIIDYPLSSVILQERTGEDYIYILYVLYSMGLNGPMTKVNLNYIQSFVNSSEALNLDYDSFYIIMQVMVGITSRIGLYFQDLGGPYLYFDELKYYAENGDMENFSSRISIVTDLFQELVNHLMRSRQSFYMVDPVRPGLEVPCNIYLEKEVDKSDSMLTVHIYFEVFGKKFDLTFYSFEGVVSGFRPSEGTSMYLSVTK